MTKENKVTKLLRKGALVMLDEMKCFTTTEGGGLRFPLINLHNDKAGTYLAHRPITAEEVSAWRASPESKGLDCAGETKLPPTCTTITLHRGRVYRVLRARCRAQLGWGMPDGGMTELETETGESAFIKRDLLRVV